MSEEETTTDVVGVRISVTILVMHPVITNPFVHRSLQNNTPFILALVVETSAEVLVLPLNHSRKIWDSRPALGKRAHLLFSTHF